jgi:DNA-binding NarL/FixJ family response regulator
MINRGQLLRMRRNLERFERRARAFSDALETFRRRRPPAPPRPPDAVLTPRELDILRLIAAGRDNAGIAAELHFGLGTIKLHIREILGKLNVSSRTEAAVEAVRRALI